MMMYFKSAILSVLVSFSLASCAQTKVIDVKSPCVAGKGSVCDRIPINTWMPNHKEYYKNYSIRS